MAAFPYHWPINTTQAYPLEWPARGRARPQPVAPVFTSAPMQTVGPPLTSAICMGAVRTLEGYTTALLLCARIAQIKNITGASGWKNHMSSKHATTPWFGASEQTQASLMLAAIQEDIDVPSSQQPPAPEFHLPTQEEISTVPLNPSTEEVAP